MSRDQASPTAIDIIAVTATLLDGLTDAERLRLRDLAFDQRAAADAF